MNYYEWSNEYYDTAEQFNKIIKGFKDKKKNASKSEKRQLDAKIAKYKEYYSDCMHIANHLRERHTRGAVN